MLQKFGNVKTSVKRNKKKKKLHLKKCMNAGYDKKCCEQFCVSFLTTACISVHKILRM